MQRQIIRIPHPLEAAKVPRIGLHVPTQEGGGSGGVVNDAAMVEFKG